MAKAKRLYPKLTEAIKNFNITSPEDKRILAEIKAEQAARKKSKGGAKDLQKELKDAKAKRKTPKFNSKGKLTANAEEKKPAAKKKVVKKPEAKKKKPVVKKKVVKKPEAKKPAAKKPVVKKKVAKKPVVKKPEAKKLSAESKPSTNAKIRRKKVNISRGKPVPVTKVDVRRSGGPKFGAGNKPATDKPATAKPAVKASSSTVGPAGERISPQSKKVPSKLLGRLANVGKTAARFAGPAGLAITAGSLLASLIPENTKGGGIGGRKGQAGRTGVDPKKVKDKPKTSAATATSAASASQTSSESTQGASSSSSFGAAFKKAKASGVSKFTWKGKSYSTATKDDVKKSGSKNLREHLNKQNKKSK